MISLSNILNKWKMPIGAIIFLCAPNISFASCQKNQVMEIQKFLSYLGHDLGPIDGVFGKKSRNALSVEGFNYSEGQEIICAVLLNSLARKVQNQKIITSDVKVVKDFLTHSDVLHGNIRYLYPINIDSDIEQEVVIVGFESQGQKHKNPSETFMQIFDWGDDGELINATDIFLEKGDEVFGGVGDISTGDFNGDGFLDIYTTAYTDSDHSVDSYALYGTGGKFRKQKVDTAAWQHAATVHDINGDGFDDVFVVGYHSSSAVYLGGRNGLEKIRFSNKSYPNGSGVSVGNFKKSDGIQVVISDNSKSSESTRNDLNIYDLEIGNNSKIVQLKNKKSLPDLYLEVGPISKKIKQKHKSHDVRVRSIDLNRDGMQDLLVFSTAWHFETGGQFSSVQTMINVGGGVFKDMSDYFVLGYRHGASVSYSPVLDDFNRDGNVDLFSIDHDWVGPADSLQIMLGDVVGRLVGLSGAEMTAIFPPSAKGDSGTVVLGPDDHFYFLRHSVKKKFGQREEFIFYQPISFQ